MDTLVLLTVLMAVVLIVWIAITHMRIEEMEKMIDECKMDVAIESCGINWPKIGEVQQPGKRHELDRWDFIEPELWCIPKLEEQKIYYLSHPCTTGKNSVEENKENEEELYKRIMRRNPKAKVIRPLKIIPEDMTHEEAMGRCFKMLDASDAIIMLDISGWESSTGCRLEYERAVQKSIDRVFIGNY